MNSVISSLFKFHREKTSSMYLFQNERLFRTALNNFCFDRGHENVGKTYCHFCAHCGTVCLKKNFSPLKWKEFSFKINLNISLRWSVGIGDLFRWNVSYVLHTNSDSFLLWDVSIYASNVHGHKHCVFFDLCFLYKVQK